MNSLYEVARVSRQAAQQHRVRHRTNGLRLCKLFEQADKMRKAHPKAGCRKMALDLRFRGMGRDKTEKLLLQNGYRVWYRPNYRRTTRSQNKEAYPNLIEGLTLSGINEVVQTDITYYRLKERHYYIVFIIDIYSRRIVGYSINETLRAEGNVRAFEMLIKIRGRDCIVGMIHHSDKGRQHIDEQYKKLLADHQVLMSMCGQAWENAYTERINRTIKEEYLDNWTIANFQQLKASVAKAVQHYNTTRRHQSLGWMSPIDFERNVQKMPVQDRPQLQIYKHLEKISTN